MTHIQHATVPYHFTLLHCPKCSVAFMLPIPDLQERRKAERSYFCPNGHEIWEATDGRVKLVGEQGQIVIVPPLPSTPLSPPRSAKPKPKAKPKTGRKAKRPNWRDSASKVCIECGSTYGPAKSVGKSVWEGQKYCSQKCFGAAHRRHLATKKAQTQEDEATPQEKESDDPEASSDIKKGEEAPSLEVGLPRQQHRLPDPRPQNDYQPVVVGETIERLDNGNCPDCGQPLNAFKVCGNCKQRKAWQSGQKAKIGAT